MPLLGAEFDITASPVKHLIKSLEILNIRAAKKKEPPVITLPVEIYYYIGELDCAQELIEAGWHCDWCGESSSIIKCCRPPDGSYKCKDKKCRIGVHTKQCDRGVCAKPYCKANEFKDDYCRAHYIKDPDARYAVKMARKICEAESRWSNNMALPDYSSEEY